MQVSWALVVVERQALRHAPRRILRLGSVHGKAMTLQPVAAITPPMR
jgi:Fe2+ transport system protein FeoA